MRTPPPSVVHLVADVDAERGGPSRSIPALCTAVAEAGVPTTLVTRPESADGLTVPGVDVRPVAPGLQAYTRAARAASSQCDVVHNHGLWLPSNHVVARAAARAGTPLVVSPRGMLEPWALAYRRWRKRLVWHLYQQADLRGAAALHATSEAEAEAVRAAGIWNPIAVLPNGVDLPAALPPRDRGPTRRALFLSRIHPKKGLPMLVRAWAQVHPTGWELLIVGPDEEGHAADVSGLARRLGVDDAVRVEGPVDDAEKWALYRSADLFVLPTYSENFGIVVAEALASEVPVLTTTGAPWAGLRSHRCGWWVAPEPAPLTDALRDATSRPRGELDAMGVRARAFALREFAWGPIGEKMTSFYKWIVNGGTTPDFLYD